VCDTYSEQPSIKDLEHVARESTVTDIEYLISGPEQKRSKDFQSQLKSPRFKRALLHFLAEEWEKQDHAERIAGHKLYLGLENKAWLYTARGDKVIRQDITELECSHEKADTRMVWHVKYISDMQGKGNVVIRCDDRDVLVIFLAHVLKFAVHVWLDVGHNNRTIEGIFMCQILLNMLVPNCVLLCQVSMPSLAQTTQHHSAEKEK